MKKIIISLFISIAFVGCNSSTQKSTTDQTKVEKDVTALKLKSYLDKFVAKNSDCMNNDITKKECSKILKDSFIKDNLGDNIDCITELPVRYETMVEYNPNKYVVKFEYGQYTSRHKLSDTYNVSFMVFSIVDKKTASKLIEKTNYYIKGKCFHFVDESSFRLPSGGYLEAYPRIYGTKSELNIDLGTLVVEDLSFESVN